MPLAVRIVDETSSTKRLALIGRLDSTTSPQFDAKIDELVSTPFEALIIDLQELSYISSAGFGALFRGKQMVEARGGRYLLVNPQPGVRKVFEIVKVLPELAVFSSVEELDRYLDTMQRRASGADTSYNDS